MAKVTWRGRPDHGLLGHRLTLSGGLVSITASWLND